MKQLDQVKNIMQDKSMNIKEVAKETGILEPNVRRILGQGTLKGIFTRVKKGIYKLNN